MYGSIYYVYPITTGKWYYEVKVMFDVNAQIGWSYTRQFSSDVRKKFLKLKKN